MKWQGPILPRLLVGIETTGEILLIAVVLDVAYQILKAFYPGEVLVIAVLLAFVPYLIVRGPAARLARRWMEHRAARPQP